MAMITIRVKLPQDYGDMELEVDGNLTIMPFQNELISAFKKMLIEKFGFTPKDMKECEEDLNYFSALPESKIPSLRSFQTPVKEMSSDFRAEFYGDVLPNKMNQKLYNSFEKKLDLKQIWDSLKEESSIANYRASIAYYELKPIEIIRNSDRESDSDIELFLEILMDKVDRVSDKLHSDFTRFEGELMEIGEELAKIDASQPETSRFALIRFLDLIANREEEGSHIKREHLRKLGLEPPQVKAIMDHRRTTKKVIQELNLTDLIEVRRLEYQRVIIREVIDRLSEGVLKSGLIKAYEAFFERLFLE